MVLKKVWVPAADAKVRDGKVRAPIDSRHGQFYEIESGLDPYFPRGFTNAIPRYDGLSKNGGRVQGSNTSVTVIDDRADDDKDSPEELDNDFQAENLVHPNMMETGLRDLVLCGSLCNTASIHHDKGKEAWEAHGDPTEVALQVSPSTSNRIRPI